MARISKPQKKNIKQVGKYTKVEVLLLHERAKKNVERENPRRTEGEGTPACFVLRRQ